MMKVTLKMMVEQEDMVAVSVEAKEVVLEVDSVVVKEVV